MAVPYKEFENLLGLASSSFEVVEETGPNEEGQSDEVDDSSGQILQEDTRKSKLTYTVKAVVKIKADVAVGATNRPTRGLCTGASSVKYFVDSVTVNDKTKHWTMTVNFHRFLDVASSKGTATATDLT